MISVNSIYEDVTLDVVVTSQNADVSDEKFSRLSRRAENRMWDYLTGSATDATPPALYSTEKIRDWLTAFIKTYTANVEDGTFTKPDDFYLYDSLVVLNSTLQADCVTGIQSKTKEQNTPVEVLDTQVFDDRMNTYVKRLKPSIKKPFSRIVGNDFEFCLEDIGSVKLLYYPYPSYGKLVFKEDPLRHDMVYDEVNSIDYMYPEWAREMLVWFIVDSFSNSTREDALKKMNAETGKSAKG